MLAAPEEMERPSKTGLRCNQGTVSLGPQHRIHAWRIGFLSGDRQRAGVHGLRHGAHCCRDLPRDRRHRCLFWPITSIPGLIGMAAIEHNRTTGDIGTSGCLRRVVQDRGLSQICRLERVPARGIIAPGRSSSGHLHRPWRATLQSRICELALDFAARSKVHDDFFESALHVPDPCPALWDDQSIAGMKLVAGAVSRPSPEYAPRRRAENAAAEDLRRFP